MHRRKRGRYAIFWRRARAWFTRLLRLRDSTHRIALGAAIGMFIAFTPTVGIQMLLVIVATWIVPANRTAGIPMVWITNPFTAVPIYTFNFELGRRLLGTDCSDLPGRLAEIWNGSSGVFSKMGRAADLLTKDFAWPLWVGSLIVGAVTGAVAYIVMYYLVALYRRRHRARRVRRRLAVAKAGPTAGPHGDGLTDGAEEGDPDDQ